MAARGCRGAGSAWLKSVTEGEWSGEQIAQHLSDPVVRDGISRRLEAHAHVLRNKLPEAKRVGLLRLMCDVALSADGIPEEEFDVLDHLRQLLGIRGEFAQAALAKAKREARADSGEEEPKEPRMSTAESSAEPETCGDSLGAILNRAKLTEVALAHCQQTCDQIRAQGRGGAGQGAKLLGQAPGTGDHRAPQDDRQQSPACRGQSGRRYNRSRHGPVLR